MSPFLTAFESVKSSQLNSERKIIKVRRVKLVSHWLILILKIKTHSIDSVELRELALILHANWLHLYASLILHENEETGRGIMIKRTACSR